MTYGTCILFYICLWLSLLRANSEIQNLDGLIPRPSCLSLFKKKTPHGRKITQHFGKKKWALNKDIIFCKSLANIDAKFHILGKIQFVASSKCIYVADNKSILLTLAAFFPRANERLSSTNTNTILIQMKIQLKGCPCNFLH